MWHRKPVVAGSFYPASAEHLSGMIREYLDHAESSSLKGSIVGVISPHAGYIYSGPVAAYSYKNMDPGTEVVVVLAPSHRARFRGASVIPDGEYETPLGSTPIDSEIGNILVTKPGFTFLKEAHQFEHSLEVQVPFLQTVLKKFSIVPIIVGTTELTVCKSLASAIADVLRNEKRSYAIVISTDLSHYHSYRSAQSMDGEFIEALKSFNVDAVQDIVCSGKAEACGEGPVLTGMIAARELGATGVEILKYANSGDTAGDKNQVVGYVSAAMVRQPS